MPAFPLADPDLEDLTSYLLTLKAGTPTGGENARHPTVLAQKKLESRI